MELANLIASQRVLADNIEEMYLRFIAKEPKSRGFLNSNAQELDSLFAQIKYQHEEVNRIVREEDINASDVPYLAEKRFHDASDRYFTFKGDILDALPQEPAGFSPLASTFAVPHNHSDSMTTMEPKLPKIQLPKFSGDYMQWIPFRDLYISLVHGNGTLSKVQKFFYLKGTLVGEAESLIQTLSVTEANYDSAWHILETRYHNKRIIVNALASRLFSIPNSDGTFQSVKVILDTARECLLSLANLEIDTLSWDPLLIPLICRKLDSQTRKDWERSLSSSTEFPKWSDMVAFLEGTFRTLESLQSNLPSISSPQRPKDKRAFTHNTNFTQRGHMQCVFCDKGHHLSKCYKFLALPLRDKGEFISAKKVCRNCLSIGHEHSNCPSSFRCTTCRQLHHTVLHSESSDMASQRSLEVSSHGVSNFSNILLYTIRLFVKTPTGIFPLRALLDPGSQGSLISESAVQLMGVPRQKSYCRIVGVGNGTSNLSKCMVSVDLWSRNREPILTCQALVLPRISSYKPSVSASSIQLPEFRDNGLADPFFYENDTIDLILGSDVCSRIQIPSESFVFKELFFQNTHFGWVFSGAPNTMTTNVINFHHISLDDLLKSFWEQEEICDRRLKDKEEMACEEYFENTTQLTSNGRYNVHLPFKSILANNVLPKLHNNSVGASRRLHQMEATFSRRPPFARAYIDFMREYESLGHMTRIGTYPADATRNSYFLPHHGVLKEDSTTTKLRVVFDGSCHLTGHKSLNDELFSGPALQNELPQIIVRWRKHRFAFSADIEKMFRQIDVCPEHRPFQQILWRYSPQHQISIYQLNTVTYGTTSAPYLAIRVLRKLAQDFKSDFPEETEILVSESYVDDILSGSDSLEHAMQLRRNLCSLLNKGGFNLRKWTSNSKKLLETIPEGDREISETRRFDRDNIVKTLGVQWNTHRDSFSVKVNIDESRNVSKRTILSDTARLYDPLGWLTPSTVIAKSVFKQLWESGITWDQTVPAHIAHQWLQYRSTLQCFSTLNIQRWIHFTPTCELELHCFCDASATAYAAVVYSRVRTLDAVYVNILQAKSKVSPIKTVSIPRLELCAATLLAKLTHKVKDSFSNIPIENIFYWSDSSTVLSWIRKSPSCWNVYVANRVAEIQRLSNPVQWRYVPSHLNPADVASRGILPKDLVECSTWWHGPSFLKDAASSWPQNLCNTDTSEERKRSSIVACVSTSLSYPDLLLKFSSFHKLLRVTALCIRFYRNCRYPDKRRTSPLSASELNETVLVLARVSQKVDFSHNVHTLISTGKVKDRALLKLMPFEDDIGIIRVGGRLHNSNLPYNVKHPILLAKTNPLSRLIISDAHEKTLHGGLTLTMSFVSRKFWILSGNQLAKRIIQSCMRCFKYSARTSNQIMGNLPAVRIHATRPFKHSGVDYAGPISVKNSTIRSAKISKGYICLFVCMVTKAIHLEPVSDLSTNAFLAAFRRFVSRRGACTHIYSDCGTNFVGAAKELQVIFNKSRKSLPEEVRQSLVATGTDWHFIPPASPNFGGLWEAGVKSVKFHLKRIMHDRVLSFEELATLLSQIESCLNSRPLCPLSTDASDFDALTPGHFLIGEPTTCIPDEAILETNINSLSRWKMVEKLKQHFWKRWHAEYLNRLQSRPKWLKPKKDAKIGELVLIADERCGSSQWLLGRITQTHPGSDQHVRVVSVITKDDSPDEARECNPEEVTD